MLTVRSIRGGVAQVGSFLPWTVREAAHAAALDLGYSANGTYSLADSDGRVLPFDASAPDRGEYTLVDTGGDV